MIYLHIEGSVYQFANHKAAYEVFEALSNVQVDRIKRDYDNETEETGKRYKFIKPEVTLETKFPEYIY